MNFRFKLFYCILIIAIVLSGCSAQRLLSKAIAKDPSIIQNDTLRIVDTVHVITDRVYADTIFSSKNNYDTVFLRKENLTVRYLYDTILKKVYLSGECESDTVERIINNEVVVQKYVLPESSFYQKYKLELIVLSIILLLFLSFKLKIRN